MRSNEEKCKGLMLMLSWTGMGDFVGRWRAGLRILRRIYRLVCGINVRKGLTSGLPSDVQVESY